MFTYPSVAISLLTVSCSLKKNTVIRLELMLTVYIDLTYQTKNLNENF